MADSDSADDAWAAASGYPSQPVNDWGQQQATGGKRRLCSLTVDDDLSTHFCGGIVGSILK